MPRSTNSSREAAARLEPEPVGPPSLPGVGPTCARARVESPFYIRLSTRDGDRPAAAASASSAAFAAVHVHVGDDEVPEDGGWRRGARAHGGARDAWLSAAAEPAGRGTAGQAHA